MGGFPAHGGRKNAPAGGTGQDAAWIEGPAFGSPCSGLTTVTPPYVGAFSRGTDAAESDPQAQLFIDCTREVTKSMAAGWNQHGTRGSLMSLEGQTRQTQSAQNESA